MTSLPGWPHQRPSRFDERADWQSCSTLVDAWNEASKTMARTRAALVDSDLPDCVVTIGVCGGLGRMEQSPFSDADLIVVINRQLAAEERQAVNRQILERLQHLDLAPARPDGIFASAVFRSDLIADESLGLVTEDTMVFGCRIQLLLDAQPIWNDEQYEKLLSDILARFERLDRISDNLGLQYMAQDLTRYYRSLSIRYHALDRERTARWRLLNIKFRHSRRVMYLGLINLIGEASLLTADRFLWLRHQLRWTPLERLLHVGSMLDRDDEQRLLRHYDQVAQLIGDRDFRRKLQQDSAAGDFSQHPQYAEAEQLLGSIRSLLHKGLLNGLDRWGTFAEEFLV